MPSQTFYNLPEAKREKLLRAARAEFARVPYPQASINRMIREAEIPRGSFYMYFADKEELFRYLLEDYGRQLAERMACRLRQAEGDVFAAFQALFDDLTEELAQGGEGTAGDFVALFRRNAGLQSGTVFPGELLEAAAQELMPLVDASALSVETEEELRDLLFLLCHLTVAMAGLTLCRGGRAEKGRQYRGMLSLLKRGAVGAPLSAGRA